MVIMSFSEAAKFVMPFGRHRGKTLDGIASDDKGLQYLDWLRGERDLEKQQTKLDSALHAYLDDDTIKNELARI